MEQGPYCPPGLHASGICIAPAQWQGVATARAPWSETGVSWETEQVGGKDVLQKQSEGEGLQIGGHREVPAAHMGLKQQASVSQGEGQRQSKQEASSEGTTGESREGWLGELA